MTQASNNETSIEKLTQRVTDLERVNATLSAKNETAHREIEGLRRKYEHDQAKTAEDNKTDWRLVIAGVAVFISAAGLLYKTSADADSRLLMEIQEAKDAASSAGKKVAPIAAKVEELQQRVPSTSEWQRSERELVALNVQVVDLLQRTTTDEATLLVVQDEIDGLLQSQIATLQRIQNSEGRIERSLLLIDQHTDSLMREINEIEANMLGDDARMDKFEAKMSSTRASITGIASEVEAQLRGIVTQVNTNIAGLRQVDAILWQKADPGSALPINDFYDHSIPARAYINVGEVGSNGN